MVKITTYLIFFCLSNKGLVDYTFSGICSSLLTLLTMAITGSENDVTSKCVILVMKLKIKYTVSKHILFDFSLSK